MPDYRVVLATGGDEVKLFNAIDLALALAEEGNKQLTFFIPTFEQASSPILANILPDKFLKKLIKERKICVENFTYSLVSGKTIQPLAERGVVLGIWCGGKMLESLDKCRLAHDIVVISWLPEQVRSWAEEKGAKFYFED